MSAQAKAQRSRAKKGHFVTCDSYVTMSDGTGIVHIAPAFGEDDSKVGKRSMICLSFSSLTARAT